VKSAIELCGIKMPLSRTNRSSKARGGKAVVVSPDGSLAFAFRRVRTGVHVERKQRLEEGSSVVHSVLFKTWSDFERFCAADPLRFEHLHTLSQASTTIRTLFSAEESHA
jgi:hypothetical protein